MIIEPTCSNDVHFIFIRHKNFFLSSKITKYTYFTSPGLTTFTPYSFIVSGWSPTRITKTTTLRSQWPPNKPRMEPASLSAASSSVVDQPQDKPTDLSMKSSNTNHKKRFIPPPLDLNARTFEAEPASESARVPKSPGDLPRECLPIRKR